MRDRNGNGLLEYGTSPVGEGLYRGTKLGAKNESMMDKSPVHDEAVLAGAAGTLDCEDVALNSLLALDGEMLACMATARGDEAEAGQLTLQLDGRPVFRSAIAGRFRQFAWDDTGLAVEVPAGEGAARWAALPSVPAARIASAQFAGEPLAPKADQDGDRFTLPPLGNAALLAVSFHPPARRP